MVTQPHAMWEHIPVDNDVVLLSNLAQRVPDLHSNCMGYTLLQVWLGLRQI